MSVIYGNYKLNNLDKINILLGKNGSGKSILLTNFEKELGNSSDYNIKYITPERAGTLKYEPSVERNIESNDKWIFDDRRKNQTTTFKQQSISQYRKLQLLFYQELDQNMELRRDETHNFQNIILGKINSLLENIEIKPITNGIETFKKGTENKIPIEKISSGESELISLAIECLVFSRETKVEKNNILLLDEPDVHLHPDLQYKLGNFLKEIVKNNSIKIIIATHSTAFIGAFTYYDNATFGLLQFGQTEVDFKKINEIYRKILPVFGAHPLSNLFNESPIFLVEGEDDFRIWQQAVRTSFGNLKLYPVDINGIDHFSQYEHSVVEIMNSVYDNPIAYSLRDRDESTQDIEDMSSLIRLRLNCRSAENLILTDEVLNNLGINWDNLQKNLEEWINNRSEHPKYNKMLEFKNSGYNRLEFNLKEIRNIIIGETGTNKPWEVAVGQAIGKLAKKELSIVHEENKLAYFLGKKLVDEII